MDMGHAHEQPSKHHSSAESRQKLQFLPAFEESFVGGKTNSEGKYVEPSPERRAFLEQQLDQFGALMSGAKFHYVLDGALNISLLNKTFIRDHKDIDMSVVDADLEALDAFLRSRGYAIVFTHREKKTEKKRCLEVVSAKDIVERKLQDLSVARINDRGIIQNTHEMVNFMDLHVHHTDADENLVLSDGGAVIPKKYAKSVDVYRTINGHSIPVSHPVLVAYHKTKSGRDHDYHDISYLNAFLSDEDRRFLRDLIQREQERKLRNAIPRAKQLFTQFDRRMSAEEIIEILERAGLGKNMEERAFIKEFPVLYKNNLSMDDEKFVTLLMDRLEVKKKAQEKLDRLERALSMNRMPT